MTLDDSDEINSPDPSILKQAMEGDPVAQFELGELYFNASYSEENDISAFKWIHRSAEQANIHAQFKLGDLYSLGKGTCQSYTDAYMWYTKAAIRGYKKALIRIHNLYQEDIRMHCRGALNSKEKKLSLIGLHPFRELNEFRSQKLKLILNHAIDYYTDLFQKCKLSNQDDPDIQQTMAFLYQNGYGVKKYTSVAMRYYTLAAKQGSVDAQYNLGHLYEKNTDIKFNYREAFHWYSLSAKGGNIAAQNCLGYFHEKGLGTDIDYQKALSWYTKAANAGHSETQVTLGKWYRKGQYVCQDYTQAVRWYKLAAIQGSQVAQNCLDLLYQTGKMNDVANEDGSFIYSTESSRKKILCSRLRLDMNKLKDSVNKNKLKKIAMNALKGDGNAMYEIGQMYYSGEDFTKDKDTSFKWIFNAANAGNKAAQFKIVEMYENGDIIEQNYHKTSIWIKTLAKKKDNVAQYKLGMLYKEGLGVRKDPLESSKWIILSTNQGNSDAMYELGNIKYAGQTYDRNFNEAAKWFYESAIQGNLNACHDFGTMYLEGLGAKKDVMKGIRVLNYAARHGHSRSQYKLGELYEEGKIVQKDLSKSKEYYSMITCVPDSEVMHDTAMKHLNGRCLNQNYIKAFHFFKKAAEEHNYGSRAIFELPMVHKSHIEEYSKLIDMFKHVSETGIASMELNVGFAYEYGIHSSFMETVSPKDFKNAIHWYSNSSKKGDSRADYRLGIMYEQGKGTVKDIPMAIKHYEKAVSADNSDAKYRLACLHLLGHDVPQDIPKAFYLFTEASNSNHFKSKQALMLLDNTQEVEHGVQNDLSEENQIRMLETMADSGLVAIQYQLGKIYEDNDDSRALKWLTLAAKGGMSDACYRLGVLYQKGKWVHRSYSIAKDLYERAAKEDHEDAIYRLARMYHFGKGTRIRYMEAYYLYLRASEMGHISSFKAINITGDPYKDSKGLTARNENDFSSKTFLRSLLMCEHVALQGNVELQFKLGTVYESRMVEPDYIEASKWYEMASSSSHKEAMYRLGVFYEKGIGVIQDYQRALQLFEQAKILKGSNAIHRLGVAYHYGQGVEVNPKKAVENYTLAAELDHSLSQHTLGDLYGNGDLAEKNMLESLKWYTRAYLHGSDTTRSKLTSMYIDTPYENYFFKRLFNILRRINSSKPKRATGTFYYSLVNRLGYWYYQQDKSNENYKKAWEYFSQPFFMCIYLNALENSFLKCDFIHTQEKNNILNQLKADEQLLDSLNGQILYELGMIYYNGLFEESKRGDIMKNRQGTRFIRKEEYNHVQNAIIKKDHLNALFYFKKSGEKNFNEAQYQLGVMYQLGHGVDKDIQEAQKWYLKAESNGNWESLVKLGNLHHCDGELQDFSKALEYYERHQDSYVYIGLLYHYGTGVDQSFEKALEYYHMDAIEVSQVTFVSFYLALAYYNTNDDSRDHEKAFRLFRRVVEKKPGNGNAFILVRPSIISSTKESPSQYKLTLEPESMFHGEAYCYLGLMYKHGHGTQQDDQKAMVCFLKANKYGNDNASKYII